jgi:hypothetical protein
MPTQKCVSDPPIYARPVTPDPFKVWWAPARKKLVKKKLPVVIKSNVFFVPFYQCFTMTITGDTNPKPFTVTWNERDEASFPGMVSTPTTDHNERSSPAPNVNSVAVG